MAVEHLHSIARFNVEWCRATYPDIIVAENGIAGTAAVVAYRVAPCAHAFYGEEAVVIVNTGVAVEHLESGRPILPAAEAQLGPVGQGEGVLFG